MERGRSAIDLALKELYESGDYADLTVICAEKSFNVHKAIVCSRSPFFKKACDGEKWVEAREGTITLRSTQDDIDPESSGTKDLSCYDPEAVKHMFDFMYLHKYGSPTSCPIDGTHADAVNLCMHASVYALGEKYGIAGLKEAALQRFKHSAELSWETDAFCKAVKIVFTSTADHDQGLRNVVLRLLSLHRREVAGNPQMEQVIRAIDGLAYDLWKMDSVLPRGPMCNACQSVYIRVCSAVHRKSTKNASADGCFLGCDCEQEQFCESHRDLGKIREEDTWS